MNDLLLRKNWVIQESEDKAGFIARIKLQDKQYMDLKRARGRLFMVLFGDNDVRPMWEDQISMKALKQQIRTPFDTEWDCPLCQPHDSWGGLAEIDNNRKYFTKIVSPKYKDGCIDEEGVYTKCVCIMKPRLKSRLKIKA